MRDDTFADQDLPYTLMVRAETESAALRAFDTHGRIATGRFGVAPGPASPTQVLTMEFDYGDGSEWGHDVDAFRAAVEQRLDEWQSWAWSEFEQGSGFPEGGLLCWRRGPTHGR